jgi:hypothetical protein
MVSMFTGIWIFGLLWFPLRRRLPSLLIWGLALFLLQMALDGTSHFISDIAGIGLGFRDTNLWLAGLTKSTFSPAFYAGDAWGSFNSSMRLLADYCLARGRSSLLFLIWTNRFRHKRQSSNPILFRRNP